MKQQYAFNSIALFYFLFFCFFTSSILASNPNLTFQENKGQVADQYSHPRHDILFSGQSADLVYHFKQDGISYQLLKVDSWKKSETRVKFAIPKKVFTEQEPDQISVYRIDIDWLGCNANAQIDKGEALQDYDNYYSEVCPNGALNVKRYTSLNYRHLYNGIDLKWYNHNGQLKYDYVVAAGADFSVIKWRIIGANNISLNQDGQLIIETPIGQIVEDKPVLLQDGKRITAAWKINGSEISFEIKNIDAAKAFTIDPLVRLWGTYYGGTLSDESFYTCVDYSSNVYISGLSRSPSTLNIATIGAHQTVFAGAGAGNFKGDAFVAKFNANGQRLWGTYYGGNGSDFANTCLADANGDVYFVGGTTSTASNVIGTPGCFQANMGGGSGIGDALIVKLNSSGTRIWATYYGDISDDWAIGACVDQTGNLYVTGGTWLDTTSTVFATSGAHKATHSSGTMNVDAYLVKFSTNGSRLWSTYYGTVEHDNGISCAVDLLGNVYMAAETSSSITAIMTTPGAHQVQFGGGSSAWSDALLIKFSNSGNRLWATYYGGANNDYPLSVKTDKFNNVYISGVTASTQGTIIASNNAFQTLYGGGNNDAFLAKFNQNGQRLFGTYYGGAGDEDASCFVDSYDQVYIAGNTSSSNGTTIASSCAYQSIYGGGSTDAYLVKLDNSGQRIWGTYYGGIGNETGGEPSADMSSNVYLQGSVNAPTGSLVIASANAQQSSFGGGIDDAFLVKFDHCSPQAPAAISNSIACKGQPAILNGSQQCGLQWFADSLLTNLLFSGGSYTTSSLLQDTSFWLRDVSCGQASAPGKIKLTIIPSPSINISASSNTICYGETLTLTVSGASTYTWLTVNSNQTSVVITATNSMVHGVDGTAANGCKASKTINIIVDMCLGLQSNGSALKQILNVYPNPSTESFTLSSDQFTAIRIYNELGQFIKDVDLNMDNQFQMNLFLPKKGLYFVTAKQNDSIITRKLLIQ